MFPTADFDHNVFTDTAEADKSLLVRFFNQSVQHNAKSLEAGRPIFRDKEYVEIKFAGNRTDSIRRPATSRDINRFPRHYKAFKDRTEAPQEGTPLSEWPRVSRSQVEELAYFNIKTVEQLASVNDSEGSKFMGFQSLKKAAMTFLEVSNAGVKANDLKAELDKRDALIAELTARLDGLQPAPEVVLKTDEIKAENAQEETPRKTRRRKKPEG